jgi:hypothetical protein
MSSQQSPANLQSTVDRDKIYQWIVELSNPETRENALLELRYFIVSNEQVLEALQFAFIWHSLLSDLSQIYFFLYLLDRTQA